MAFDNCVIEKGCYYFEVTVSEPSSDLLVGLASPNYADVKEELMLKRSVKVGDDVRVKRPMGEQRPAEVTESVVLVSYLFKVTCSYHVSSTQNATTDVSWS